MAIHTNERYVREHWDEWNGVGEPPAEFGSNFDLGEVPVIPPEGHVVVGATEQILSWRTRDPANFLG
jgi:hypothetical protein